MSDPSELQVCAIELERDGERERPTVYRYRWDPDDPSVDIGTPPHDCSETFRLIAEAAGADGTDPESWRAMTYSSPGEYALQAVRELRVECDNWKEDYD